jgi:hypothetical protein
MSTHHLKLFTTVLELLYPLITYFRYFSSSILLYSIINARNRGIKAVCGLVYSSFVNRRRRSGEVLIYSFRVYLGSLNN